MKSREVLQYCLNVDRGSFVTFCERRVENEVKSEWFLHPQFTNQITFYPHPTSGKYGFKNPKNNQAGVGIATEIVPPIRIENEANNSSTPKPRYIPIPTKTKGRFARTQNRMNNKSPVPPPGLPNNAAPDRAWTSSRRNSARTPPPPTDPLLSM